MSIFSTLGIAKQGLLANGRAIQIASNNIANVNTPGYTRQRAVFSPIISGFTPGGFPQGGGVEIGAVIRIFDATLDAQLQRERQELSFNSAVDAGLSRVESIFGELSGTGLTAALSGFFESMNDLANSPGEAERTQVVQRALSVTDQIRDMDRRIYQLQLDANQQVSQSITDINAIAVDIAELNGQIFRTEVGGVSQASALRDRRAELLGSLAEKVDFTSFERLDGQVSVFVASGFLLVDAETAGGLQATANQAQQPLSDPSFFQVFHNIDGSVAGPITSGITGGKLGAAINLRDSRLLSYRNSLDEFAFTFARRVNDLHYQPGPPAAAFGLDDDTSRRLFVDTGQTATTVGVDLSSVAGAARLIGVNSGIASNVRHLAAGTTSLGAGLGAALGDNMNALAMASLEVSSLPFYKIGDPPAAAPPAANPGGTLGQFLDSLAGRLGAETQSQRRAVLQAELLVAELQERRGALSGVSIDEEVIDLIRFEKAYQASARLIQITNDLLDRLLSL